jgi:hypothetical protein
MLIAKSTYAALLAVYLKCLCHSMPAEIFVTPASYWLVLCNRGLLLVRSGCENNCKHCETVSINIIILKSPAQRWLDPKAFTVNLDYKGTVSQDLKLS